MGCLSVERMPSQGHSRWWYSVKYTNPGGPCLDSGETAGRESSRIDEIQGKQVLVCDRRRQLLREVGLVKYTVIVLLCSLALGASGCQGDRAEDLYELATFEEQQNNPDHARQLYEEILQDYPGTEYAMKSQERLRELKPGQ